MSALRRRKLFALLPLEVRAFYWPWLSAQTAPLSSRGDVYLHARVDDVSAFVKFMSAQGLVCMKQQTWATFDAGAAAFLEKLVLLPLPESMLDSEVASFAAALSAYFRTARG